jgi:hypothetical protein
MGHVPAWYRDNERLTVEVERLRDMVRKLGLVEQYVRDEIARLRAENKALKHLLSIDHAESDVVSIDPKWKGWH